MACFNWELRGNGPRVYCWQFAAACCVPVVRFGSAAASVVYCVVLLFAILTGGTHPKYTA